MCVHNNRDTHENSVVLVFEVHLLSMAEYTGVGTGYSVMKLPFVSLTFLVTPRLMVWRRRQAVSTPPVSELADEMGRPPAYGSPYASGSMGLANNECARTGNIAIKHKPWWVEATGKARLASGERLLLLKVAL